MGSADKTLMDMIRAKTLDVMLSIIRDNKFDVSWMTEDASWYIGSSADRLTAKDIPDYLNDIWIDLPIDAPKLIFANTEFMGNDSVSVTGKYEYNARDYDPTLISVCFNADWVIVDDEWKLKKLITSSRKDFDNEDVINDDVRIDKSALYNTLPVGIICCTNDEAMIVQLMNKHGCSLLGFSSIVEYKRNVGESIQALIHPEDYTVFRQFVEAIKTDGYAESEPFRVRRKDFSYLWVQFLGSLAEGKWIVFSCINHDEHQEKIEALVKENEKTEEEKDIYRMMVNYMPGGFHCCALFEPIHLEYVSDTFCQMCGYTREEIRDDLNSMYIEMVAPDDRHMIIETLKSLMEYPHIEQMEYRLLKKDGTTIWVTDFIRSVRHNDGKLWAYSIVEDIDESHSMRKQLYSMTEEMPIGFATYRYINGALKFLYCNDAYAESAGYSMEEYSEIIQHSPFALVHEEDMPLLERELNHMVWEDECMSAECEFRIHGKNGDFRARSVVKVESDGNNGYLARVYQQTIPDTDDNAKAIKEPDSNQEQARRVEVRTFGYFEVYVDGEPINFRSQKARELMALLVDRRGGYVTQSMIISALWENESANKTTLARCRKTYKTLLDKLNEYGVGDILESDRGARRIVPDKIKCDLYDYLSGSPQYKNLFKGNYMMDYSWSELTLSELLEDM